MGGGRETLSHEGPIRVPASGPPPRIDGGTVYHRTASRENHQPRDSPIVWWTYCSVERCPASFHHGFEPPRPILLAAGFYICVPAPFWIWVVRALYQCLVVRFTRAGQDAGVVVLSDGGPREFVADSDPSVLTAGFVPLIVANVKTEKHVGKARRQTFWNSAMLWALTWIPRELWYLVLFKVGSPSSIFSEPPVRLSCPVVIVPEGSVP